MGARVALAWAFLAVVWGTTWAAVKVGLADLPPMTFAGVRFALAAVLLLLVMGLRRAPPPRGRGQWGLVVGTALVTISLQYGLQFWGQQYVASGLAAVITATIPVFVLLFAHWNLPTEPMTPVKALGVLAGFGGVVVIFSDQLRSEGALALAGSAGLLLGSAASARAQVYIKQHIGSLDPLVLATWQMVIGAVPLLLVGVALDGGPTAAAWTVSAVGALLYLSAFGSAAAFLLLYWLFRRMAVTKVLAVAFVNPAVAVLVGWWFLGEVLSWRAVAGTGAILLGVGLIVRPERVLAVPAASGGRRG